MVYQKAQTHSQFFQYRMYRILSMNSKSTMISFIPEVSKEYTFLNIIQQVVL